MPVKICSNCKGKIDAGLTIGRNTLCPHCKSGIHICANCKYFDDTKLNKCGEPQAEYGNKPFKVNFCDFFSLREENILTVSSDEAKKKFDSFFK